jgi:hypothetical protein
MALWPIFDGLMAHIAIRWRRVNAVITAARLFGPPSFNDATASYFISHARFGISLILYIISI